MSEILPEGVGVGTTFARSLDEGIEVQTHVSSGHTTLVNPSEHVIKANDNGELALAAEG